MDAPLPLPIGGGNRVFLAGVVWVWWYFFLWAPFSGRPSTISNFESIGWGNAAGKSTPVLGGGGHEDPLSTASSSNFGASNLGVWC